MKLLPALIAAIALLGLPATFADEAANPADELWLKLQTLQRQGPQAQGTTAEESHTIALNFLREVETLADAFIRQFPDDPRVWEARLDKLTILAVRAKTEEKPVDLAVLDPGVATIVDSETTSKPVKAAAALLRLEAHAVALLDKPDPEKLGEFDTEITTYLKDYPTARNTRALTAMRIDVYEKVDATKAEALLKTLAEDKDPYVARDAKRRLKTRELTTKPLDLKFTTVDGKEFDITEWRGKVVLVDFWATWCGPCRAGIAEVVATYQKLHNNGFEIVGISLDKDKEKLLAYAKDQQMPWPQFFDGKGWENEISTKFGIGSIPTMWLIDKKGIVRNTEPRHNLGGEIAKLLAE